MTLAQTMKTLESMGTAQNRKVYARHGAGENTFGVSFANLGKLKKQIKTDQDLARQLWETGNFDARSLAALIADPGTITERDLDAWIDSVNNYCHADAIARHVASSGRFARRKAGAWSKSKKDFAGQAGWDLVAMLAMQDTELPDGYFEERLEAIGSGIHKSNNRTKHAMNGALIGIGMRNSKLEKTRPGRRRANRKGRGRSRRNWLQDTRRRGLHQESSVPEES